MLNVDTVIHARWIVPMTPGTSVLENHSIAIQGDRIIGIEPTTSARQKWQGRQELARLDHVLMPGLVNAHAHTPSNLFRGLADDLSLMDWLKNHIWPAELAILNSESIKDGMNLAILELLRGGVTCFCDHFFFHDTAAQVVIDTGIRANIALWIGNVETVWGKNEAEYFEKAKYTLNSSHKHPRLSWSLGPHSPYMVTRDAFIKIKNLADEFKLPIHLHLHETQAEIEDSINRYGKRPIQWLKELGIVCKDLVAVHLTQLTPEEIEILAENGVSAVHCPESNLKLASGFAPVGELIAAGVTTALGTDGAASNNDLDMFGELRTAALLGKGLSRSPTVLPALQVLQMATINGAKAFGLDHEIGSLKAGKAADIITVDLGSYLTQPVYNPISHLAYAVNRLQVSDVWVAGKLLLDRGEFTQLDPVEILNKSKAWVEKAMPFRSQASIL